MKRPHRTRGFTLIEALVGVLLLALIMIAFLTTLDASARMAKSQGNISDITENLRFATQAVVRVTRMAGTGGLPLVTSDAAGTLQPLAIQVEDNADTGRDVSDLPRTPLAWSDVLRIRGVITHDLWDVNGPTGEITYSGGDDGTGTITISSVSPFGGGVQALTDVSDGDLLLVSTQFPISFTNGSGVMRDYGDYRVVEVSAAASPSGTPETLTIQYRSPDQGSVVAAANRGHRVQDNFTAMTITAGLLDDIAYFVALNEAGLPSLYRFQRSTGTAEELVPGIANFQVAMGCDTDGDGEIVGNEWFLTAANPSHPTGQQMVALREVRLSVVGRSQDPDMDYTETIVMPENSPAVATAERDHRFRILTVQVSLRSHPQTIAPPGP